MASVAREKDLQPSVSYSFHTIGHGTRSVDELAALLREADVTLLVDVRTIPRSRTNPQFNQDVLPQSLAPFQIGYEHIASLGGRRSRQSGVSPDTNAFWQNQSFHNYADYALTADFQAGLARLRSIGRERRCAIMCAETLWWQCHRRIITDYLIAMGETVFHIIGPRKIEPARMTSAARHTALGELHYPAQQ